MWNLFHKKLDKSKADATPRQVNRVDDLANGLQKSGRIQDLESELATLNRSSLSPAELESWWHLYGIVAFQEGRDSEALERFKEAYSRFPESATIRFSLGQQHIRARDPERGFELFRTCIFPAVSREYALAQARYAYIWSRYDDGLLFVRPFFETYKQIKILDDHFLYVRGLPFFGTWWAYLASFAILSGQPGELESVTKSVTETCYDYDFAYLQKQLMAHLDDDPLCLLSAAEGRLRSMPEGNYPTGYTRMHIAVIKARAADTLNGSRQILEDVMLSEQDFRWLEDIRLLALAEAAHRFSETSLEQDYVLEFIKRQPMLFEPDIALNFHLLRYQEHLKPMVVPK